MFLHCQKSKVNEDCHGKSVGSWYGLCDSNTDVIHPNRRILIRLQPDRQHAGLGD